MLEWTWGQSQKWAGHSGWIKWTIYSATTACFNEKMFSIMCDPSKDAMDFFFFMLETNGN